MQKISNFFFGIGQGIAGLFRHKLFSLASIATMAACLFIFGIFSCLLTNLRHMITEAENNVGITVFFDEGTTEEEINEIKVKIGRRSGIYNIEYTSAEEAWENYKATKLSPELAASFGNDNPLKNSASLTIYLSDVTAQDSLIRFVSSIDGVRKCNGATELVDSLTSLNNVIAAISIVIIAVLLLVSTFLISITISMGVSVRRKEISIMKLIGATDHFIKVPYVVEGILIGCIGAVIPLETLRFAYPKLMELLSEKYSSIFSALSFLDKTEIFGLLTPAMLAIGIGIGFVGSNATLNKQLRKIEVS